MLEQISQKIHSLHQRFHLIFLVFVSLFSILFGYSLVFSSSSLFDDKVEASFVLSDNIYLDSLTLRNTKIVFKSWIDLENASIFSHCNIYSKLLAKERNFYLFDIKFLDNSCVIGTIDLRNESGEIITRVHLNMRSEYTLFSHLLDHSTDVLLEFEKTLDTKIQDIANVQDLSEKEPQTYYDFLKQERVWEELMYAKNLISSIITGRQKKIYYSSTWAYAFYPSYKTSKLSETIS